LFIFMRTRPLRRPDGLWWVKKREVVAVDKSPGPKIGDRCRPWPFFVNGEEMNGAPAQHKLLERRAARGVVRSDSKPNFDTLYWIHLR